MKVSFFDEKLEAKEHELVEARKTLKKVYEEAVILRNAKRIVNGLEPLTFPGVEDGPAVDTRNMSLSGVVVTAPEEPSRKKKAKLSDFQKFMKKQGLSISQAAKLWKKRKHKK